MKKITYLLMAALFCGSYTAFAQDDEVKVTPAFDNDFEPTFKFNSDYKYYGILLDDETKEANLTDEQYVYIGPDAAAGRNLWVWENTFTFNTPSGQNSFGIPDAYLSLKVGTVGWSGLGYANDNAIDLSGITSEYTLHFAIKSTSKESFDFKFGDGTSDEAGMKKNNAADIVLGSKAYDKAEPVADFERDGEWYNIDIPVSYLEDNFGLSLSKNNAFKGNILSILAGGVSGTVVDYDAVFFYGPKASTGIKNIQNENSNGAIQYFSVDGKQVPAAQAKVTKGLYIVKQNGKTKKVIL